MGRPTVAEVVKKAVKFYDLSPHRHIAWHLYDLFETVELKSVRLAHGAVQGGTMIIPKGRSWRLR